MRLASSPQIYVRRVLPLLTTVALAGVGVWTLHPRPSVGGLPAEGLATVLLSHAPVVFPIIVGLSIGLAVWLLQKANTRHRELQAANQTLAHLNEQLNEEFQKVVESERRSQLLFLSNPCPMWVFDCATLAVTDVNDAALRQYGYTRDEFLRLTALDLRPPEEHERFMDRLGELDPGYGFRGVWAHRHKDGTHFPVEIRAFRFVHGGALRELVLGRDVSARVEAEQALARSEAAMKSMFDNAPFGICRTALAGDRFVELNPALAEMLGYSRDEMLGLKISSQVYTHPDERSRLVDVLRRTGRLNAFESTWRRKDGSLVRVREWGVLRDDGGQGPQLLDAYVQNITEHSTLEQQVRQVQKLEAVGRLAGGIAHDFNNILVVIRLSTELMLGKITMDSPLSKPLLQVLSAADRAASLTRQLLAFGRQQMMQTRTINLNTVVSETLQLLRRTIGEDIEVVRHLDPDLRNTRLDPDQLAQVIMNLAINSRDAMPSGGTLEIETRNADLDAAYARAHEPVQPGKYAMLAVTDSGAGIDAALLPRIFDPFFTTKELGKGTGLGLSIVYGIVKQSGGYIWVYSEPGRGTTFKLYFPITDSALECKTERAEPQAITRGKRILVVEDERHIRQNLCECLRQLGCEVIEAADGIEALDRFKDQQGKIDLVLTDLVMPRMSGQELWRQLTQLHPELSFLFMSGYSEYSAMRQDILSRQTAFLNKPFSVAELSSAIQRALALQALQRKQSSVTA